MEILSRLIEFWGLGISVIPVRPHSKVAACRWLEYTQRLTTPEELMRWFGQPTPRNCGVVCGQRHGQPGYLVVVDFDDLGAALERLPDLPETYQVLTARGLHAYFLCDEPSTTTHFAGGDVKASGYVLGAGSIHPSGTEYRVWKDTPMAHVRRIQDVIPEAESPKTPPAPPILSKPPVPSDAWDAAMQCDKNLAATIRARVSILHLLPDAKPTSRDKRWYIARCPLHDDHTPSLWIDASRGLCGCYAGCAGGRAMDVINLTAAMLGVGNSDALERLRKEVIP